MAQVIVKINGYTYTVGCEDGQENHLAAMAQQVENRVQSIKALGGSAGEARLLVLTALLMADELHDMRIELEAARSLPARPAAKSGRSEGDMARKINRLTARAEQIAADLERP